MMQATIRHATHHDISRCLRLANDPSIAAAAKRTPERWWMKSFIVEGQPFFIAEHRGSITGFLFGEFATGNVAFLHTIFVSQHFRRHGVGIALLKAFEQECKKKHIRAIVTYASIHAETFFAHRRYRAGAKVREFQKNFRLREARS